MHRLYLHIGTHKTGTTSVQRFLASNRELLRELGLVYPNNSLGGFPEHHTHHHIAHAMANKPRLGTPEDACRFFDRLRDDMVPGEVAVISAESMYRHVFPRSDSNVGPNYNVGGRISGDPLRYIRTVRDCLKDFDVTVMVMLRRQDSFIESLYAEAVLSSSFQAGIDSFITQRGWLADYDDRLGMWGDVFGPDNLSVRVFEPKSFEVPIERFFVEWLRLTWDARLELGGKHNVTVPRPLVEYKRAINGEEPKSVSTTYRRWLEQLAATTDSSCFPDIGRHYLTYEARAELMKRFGPGNRRVAEQYLDQSELFTESGEATPYGDPPELGSGDFRTITRMLLRSIAGS